MGTPAEPCGEKRTVFVQLFCKRRERGFKFFGHVSDLFAAAPAQELFYEFFFSKMFVHPTLSLLTEGVFWGSFSPRVQNAKVGWELAVDF